MALKSKSTQDFVPIKEIRDGIVVLKNGAMRAILIASSINLALKADEEQQAVILQFQSFLNALDFDIQIVVQSRRLDIRPYTILLEERYTAQTEPLLKLQIREYINFVKELDEQSNIMTKNFFIVVPYDNNAPITEKGGLVRGLFGNKKNENKGQELYSFEEKRAQLDQRVAVVSQGLSRIGVRTTELGTEEAVELFYRVFNPGESTGIAGVLEKNTVREQ